MKAVVPYVVCICLPVLCGFVDASTGLSISLR